MKDIIIDGISYDFIAKTTLDNKDYVVFEDEVSIYVCEYFTKNGEIFFNPIEDELEDKILESLGISYES